MSKRDNPIVLILAILITGGLMIALVQSMRGIFQTETNSGQNNNPVVTGQRDTINRDNLKILGDTFSGYSTFRNPEFQAALKEAGLTLTYQDEFDQGKRANLLNQGQADLLVTTLDQFIKQQPRGKIVALLDRTVGADAVVLNTQKYPQLKSLLDLNQLVKEARSRGEKLSIAYAGDTPSEYLALVLSTKFDNFNLSDFNINTVADASEAWQLLQDPQQNVAVAVLWEPFVTQAKQQGYTVVLSSQDAPTAIVDVLVASDNLIQSQPEKISNLLEVYYRRIDANVREPVALLKQIAEDGNLSEEEATAVLDGIDFFTSVEAKEWMTNRTLETRIGSTAAVLVLSGKLNNVPANPNQLYSSQLITKAAANTETLISLVRADNPELADKLAGKGTITASANTVTVNQVKNAPDIGNLTVRGEVQFDVGSSDLTLDSEATLQKLGQEIGEFNPQTVAVRIIGHTSKTGSPDFNQQLSEQRAQAVVNYLRSLGLKHQLVAEGKGFYLPLSGIPPEDSRQQRTEIRLVRINELN